MNFTLRLSVLAVALILLIVILLLLKRGRVPVKFSILWIISIFLLILLVLFPDVISWMTHLLGFRTMSNMVTGFLILILFFITISLTVIVSGQTTKIQLLIQELSLLKKSLEDLKSKNDDEPI